MLHAMSIVADIHRQGFSLVRQAIPTGRVALYRKALEDFAPKGAVEFPVKEFQERSGLSFLRLFAAPSLAAAALRLVGPSRSTFSTFLLVTRARGLILFHTDGIIQGHFDPVLCLWAPLHPCGRDAPGLSVVPANRDRVLRWLRHHFPNKPLPGWYSETEWNQTDAFNPAAFEREFGPAFSPEMTPGDVMVFTNWTIHASYALPHMTRQRAAAVLRLTPGPTWWLRMKARGRRLLPS